MPVERQVCQRCGHIFAAIEVNTVTFHSPGRIIRISEERKCLRCGGLVLWVSGGSTPLSAKRRIAEMRRHLKMALLWVVVALAMIGLLFLVKSCLGWVIEGKNHENIS